MILFIILRAFCNTEDIWELGMHARTTYVSNPYVVSQVLKFFYYEIINKFLFRIICREL
jgi:hypothetical protein